MYYNGHGVFANHIKTHIWFNIAGADGNEIGSENRQIIAKKKITQN